METLGNKMKELRLERQFTRKALAARCGISEIAIRKYETDERHPKPSQLKKIAQALNISPFVLCNCEDLNISLLDVRDNKGNIIPNKITIEFNDSKSLTQFFDILLSTGGV